MKTVPHTTKQFIMALLLAMSGSQAPADNSATSTLSVTAQVQSSCTVSATGLEFKSYDGSAEVSGTATVSFECKAIVASASIDLGGGNNLTSPNQRRMASAGDTSSFLNYNLYTDSSHSTLWFNGNNGTGHATFPAGKEGKATVYGLIPKQEGLNSGSYSDNVTVTLNYP